MDCAGWPAWEPMATTCLFMLGLPALPAPLPALLLLYDIVPSPSAQPPVLLVILSVVVKQCQQQTSVPRVPSI